MYIALKPVNVQGKNGKQERRKPGAPVPEAEHWTNVKAYLNRGVIALAPNDHPAAKLRVNPEYFAPKIVSNKKKREGMMAREQAYEQSSDARGTLMGMEKDSLIKFAKAEYGLKLKQRMNKEKMVDAIIAASQAMDGIEDDEADESGADESGADESGAYESEADVLYQFALAMPKPDVEILEDFVRRYPQHTDALTQFAVELALEGETEPETGDETETEPETGDETGTEATE